MAKQRRQKSDEQMLNLFVAHHSLVIKRTKTENKMQKIKPELSVSSYVMMEFM